jgi:hypothetical protein
MWNNPHKENTMPTSKHDGTPDVVRTDEQLIRDIVRKLMKEDGDYRWSHVHNEPLPHTVVALQGLDDFLIEAGF